MLFDIQSKSFNKALILNDIKLNIKPGESIAILGPSGTGKSTLLRIMAGLDRDFVGSVPPNIHCALMFQQPNLLAWRSVYHNLSIFHPNASDSELHYALGNVELLDKKDHYPHQLSLGQQRRLSLARAFLGTAELILLDEPFASLDDRLRDEMLALAVKHCAQKQCAAVLVTHSLSEAQSFATSIYQLRDGGLYLD